MPTAAPPPPCRRGCDVQPACRWKVWLGDGRAGLWPRDRRNRCRRSHRGRRRRAHPAARYGPEAERSAACREAARLHAGRSARRRAGCLIAQWLARWRPDGARLALGPRRHRARRCRRRRRCSSAACAGSGRHRPRWHRRRRASCHRRDRSDSREWLWCSLGGARRRASGKRSPGGDVVRIRQSSPSLLSHSSTPTMKSPNLILSESLRRRWARDLPGR